MTVKARKTTFHVSWFSDVRKMDLRDPRQKREWIQMVLCRGMARDIRRLNLKDVEKFLPQLHLPQEIRELWQNYFSKRSQ